MTTEAPAVAPSEEEAPAAPPAAPLTAQPEPSEEPPSGDGAETAGADATVEEAAPWSALTSWDELAEHDEVKPRLAELREQAKREGHSEAQRRLQPHLTRKNTLLQDISTKQAEFFQSWQDALTDGTLSNERLRELQRDPQNRQMFEALSGVKHQEGMRAGALGVLADLAQEVKSEEFQRDFAVRISNLLDEVEDNQARTAKGEQALPLSDPELFKDMKSVIVSEAVKADRAEREAELTKKIEARLRAEIQAEAKKNGAEPARTAGTGGGGQKAYKDMTPEERAALSDEERDRLANAR